QPKLLLPWGKTTVLGQVISTFAAAGVKDLVVVTGAAHEKIDGIVKDLSFQFPVRVVFNPGYADGEMLSSIQVGLAAQNSHTLAALIGLGDQPQVLEETVRGICSAFARTKTPLVIPSFQNRRGHPWLAARELWSSLLALPTSTTARRFLNAYSGQVQYIMADRTILQDLDTPADYARLRP
ncbi:MAG: nucleotidyltransferase family protein, partial [Anaerolineales bacterium]